MTIDSGWVVAAVALCGTGFSVLGWVARHYIRDVAKDSREPRKDNSRESRKEDHALDLVTMQKLEAALAKNQIELLELFNGRYPSKDVFLSGMRSIESSLTEIRRYIGDVKRELGSKMDREGDNLAARVLQLERRQP